MIIQFLVFVPCSIIMIFVYDAPNSKFVAVFVAFASWSSL